MSGNPRLQLQSLTVRFGRAVGLEGVTFSVEAGETLAIVGTSGAGKSSVLRTIAGLDPVIGGSLRIDGVERSSSAPEDRGAVYLHQSPLLFPHLSVAENIAFPLQIRRNDSGTIERRVRELLETLNLTALADRNSANLSGGQQHRVALARAIAARPPVLLLDEPLTGLDPAMRSETLEAIRTALSDYNPATLYVTHDLAEAGAIAHRIGVLLDGAIRQISAPLELFEHPGSAAVATFVGFTNRIQGRVDGSAFTGGGLEIPLQTELRGPAVLLFRPQALFMDDSGELCGEILSVMHSPAGPRLRVRILGLELDASVRRGGSATVGNARFRLDPLGARIFPAR
jgi:putative spermidine/putrescine transport system ATP-binding protein